jgi:adenylate cyclase
MERRLAAILAGDVVGYSRLMAEDEAATFSSVRSGLEEVVGPAVERHAGYVFKTTGDGFLAVFGSANEALDAALAIQHGFDGRPLRLRLGLNLGDVIEQNGDLYGDGVNVASRLEAMAEPGQIFVSAAVVRSAAAKPGLAFDRIGRRRAKNIPYAIEVYQVRRNGVRPRRLALPIALAAGVAGLAALGAAGWHYEPVLRSALAAYVGGDPPSGAQSDTRPAVAVLPFDNLGGDPAEDYFSDGLTEDIITALAQHGELMVIARNSTFAFKGRPADIREVGAELGAGYVVEGSARRAGDQLRVVAQLIDAESGAHLWSRSYDRRVEDVFALQAELTTEIVASLVSYVRQSETEMAAARPTESLRAYDLVLRARAMFAHGSTDAAGLIESRRLYERAVALDPDYAAARAQLGLTYIADHANQLTGASGDQVIERGLVHVREALRTEPDLAFGYQVLSFGLAANGDYQGSIQAAQRAVELNPSDPDSMMSLAKAQVRFGAYEEAVRNAERARRLNPLAPHYYAYVHGQALYAADRQQEADAALSGCLLQVPDDGNCLRIRAAVLVQLGQLDQAKAVMAQLIAVEPAFSLSAERAYRRFGNSPVMDRYLADLAAAGAVENAGQALRQRNRDLT